MTKKMLKLICLSLLTVIVATFLALTISSLHTSLYADTGTCCRGGSQTCTIGSYSQKNAYYVAEGPCPPSPI